MITPLLGSCGNISGSTTSNQWINPWGGTNSSARSAALGHTAGGRACLIGAAGTINHLRIALDGTVGTGRSITFVVTKNGVDTALTLTISDPATTGTDLIHSFTVVEGDLVEIRVVQSSNTANIVNARWGMEWSGSTLTQTFVGTTSGVTGPSTGSTTYMAPWTGGGGSSTDFVWGTTRDVDHEDICPLAATITALYVSLITAPASGKQWVFSLVINGTEDTSTRVTIANTATTGNVTGLAVAVAAGDTIAVMCVPTGTPTSAAGVRIACQITPTTTGENPMCGHQFNTSFVAGSTMRMPLMGAYHAFGNSANERNGILTTDAESRDLRWELSSAPGGSKTVTAAGRINDAATSNISVAIADPSTTGSDLTHHDSLVAGDAYEWQTTHTSGTTSSSWRWGSVLFVQTAASTYTTFGVLTREAADDDDMAPTVTYYFEATLKATGGYAAHARLYNITDAVVVTGTDISTTSLTQVRVRSASFTMPSGSKEYRAEFGGAPSSGTYTCYAADIIADVSG